MTEHKRRYMYMAIFLSEHRVSTLYTKTKDLYYLIFHVRCHIFVNHPTRPISTSNTTNVTIHE